MWLRRDRRLGSVTSFIDEGAVLDGKCSFAGTLILNGRFIGELESSGTLVVGASAAVQADIRARVVTVRGEVIGNITASERIELTGGARVCGDIETPVLVVEAGALMEGRTRMTDHSRNGGARAD